MNKEIRDFLDKNNIIIKKITIKKNTKIIDDGKKQYVIKKKENNIKEIYKYLKSRSFYHFPNLIAETKNYDIYEYINSIDIPNYETSEDIIKLITLLHNKTTYYKDIDDDNYKELYENIKNEIEYLYNYYEDISELIEKEEYMSPSHYYLIRNITKIFQALNYAKQNIEKWYKIIEEKKRVRIVNIHNNLSLEHYLLSEDNKSYLISWQKSKKDFPIYDLLNLYKQYYNELDFYELLKNYEKYYPLLPEEKKLLFVLISIPQKLELNDKEYNLCKKINNFYNYLSTSDKLIGDYELQSTPTK